MERLEIECYKLLKVYHKQLTRQQLLTLKGQLKKKEFIAMIKGLNKILKERG